MTRHSRPKGSVAYGNSACDKLLLIRPTGAGALFVFDIFRRLWLIHRGGGDVIVFLGIWLMSTIFVGQDRVVVKGDFYYWVAVVPAMLLPALRLRQTIQNLLFGIARPLAIFCVVGAGWALVRDDYSVIAPLFLFVWVAAWASREEAVVSRRGFFVLLLMFYSVGAMAFFLQPSFERFPWMMEPPKIVISAGDVLPGVDPIPVLPDQTKDGLDLNPWGVMPFQTAPAFGPWRISVTPKIATSGLVSFLALLIFFQRPSRKFVEIAGASFAAYFALLSLMRGVLSAALLFVAVNVLQRLIEKNASLRGIAALMVPIGLVAAMWVAPYVLHIFQGYDVVSQLLLRGQNNLSVDDIWRQLYRPWLWLQHFELFIQSDYLMGVGSELSKSARSTFLNAHHVRSDSDALLTRLLATYGVASFGLFYFIAGRCVHHAKSNDIWAVSMIAVLVWLMMTWGSSFHPSNGVFVISFLVMGKGSKGFSSVKPAS